MLSFVRVALVMWMCCVNVCAVVGQATPAAAKAKVELRWIEGRHIEGLTDEKMGFPGSENQGDVVYPHKKPAMVLTPSVVQSVSITHFALGGRDQYGLKIQLTDKARAALANSFRGPKTRWITVTVDGKCWGYRRYEPRNEKSGYSKASWASHYNPHIGFTSSKAYVQRVADALE